MHENTNVAPLAVVAPPATPLVVVKSLEHGSAAYSKGAYIEICAKVRPQQTNR